MLQIRKSTFETNSSSMHCIVLGKGSLTRSKEVYIDIDELEDILEGNEEVFENNASMKLSYLVRRGGNKGALAKIIKNFCGADVYVGSSKIKPSDLDAQYVVDEVKLPFIRNEEDIIEFIFNTAYIIYANYDGAEITGAEYDDYELISIDGMRVIY